VLNREPLLTVIMPHFRCEQYLYEAASSILNQSMADLQLVIVDDCSPTNEWLNSLRPLMTDPRLLLRRTTRNVGPYRIANRLVREIRSPLIGFQDSDDISHPDRFAIQVAAMSRTRADIVGCGFILIDELGYRICRKRMPRFATLLQRLGKKFVVHHPTTLVRRSVLELLGGYDGTTRFGGDTEFLLRASYLCRMRNISKYLYFYRQRRDSLTLAADTGFLSVDRQRYLAQIAHKRMSWRRIRDRSLLVASLQGSPNNIEFDIQPTLES
jgi:glycosyltransferase involved in cell wall biosynthesis